MTTMLEKAAAAAWPFLWDATDTATPAHDAARARMRAALQAIREPDDVRHLLGQLRGNGTLDWEADDGQTWTVLIDAILAEDKA